MEIIEAFVKGKRTNQTLCEDGYIVTPYFAAVVDGSTSKIEGENKGREAMLCILEAIKKLSPKANKEQMLYSLTSVLAKRNTPLSRYQAQFRLTCSAVIYSCAHRCIWIVGDCQCRFSGKTFIHIKIVDSILSEVRSDMLHYLIAHGHSVEDLRSNDLARNFILNILREQTNFQNDLSTLNPYRYAVIDGTAIDPYLVPEIPIPATVKECVLASDGYPQLFDTLSETEEMLKTTLLNDPLCINSNQTTKGWLSQNNSFDDRCYLKIDVD